MASRDQVISETASEQSEGSNSNSFHTASTQPTAPEERVHRRFSAWNFQLQYSADATALHGGHAHDSVSRCVTLQERHMFLLEHIKSRILSAMPDIVTFVQAFYDSSIISGTLPEGMSTSIRLCGFVQTRARTNCRISTMQNWIYAAWTPIPGGLASNKEYKDIVARSTSPNDSLLELRVFGSLALNNPARKTKREVSRSIILLLLLS